VLFSNYFTSNFCNSFKSKFYIFLCSIFVFLNGTQAQDFLNNDLNGNASTDSQLPNNWQSVPHTDIFCRATGPAQATPDLTDINGPGPQWGIVGNPYSGNTFITGLFGGPPVFDFWHEGIMQTVNGFTVGSCYSVNFYQAVVKQAFVDYLDSTGCWAVYLDSILIGKSSPTLSQDSFASTSFPWEFRSMVFTATSPSHTIKFLPADDDNDQSTDNPYGGLRMGIDSIFISSHSQSPISINLGADTSICSGQIITLDASTSGAAYLWQNNSTNATFTVTKPGTYWVSVSLGCETISDTIVIDEKDCEVILEMPNVFTPNGDGVNDVFIPAEYKAIERYNLQIFNRWGSLIYQSNDVSQGWDGTFQGALVADGVYFYIVNYLSTNNDNLQLNGTVTLIK